MQGIQEALMSLVGQKESPVKQRNYKNGENKVDYANTSIVISLTLMCFLKIWTTKYECFIVFFSWTKIIPRLETFSKMFGSEIFYNQIAVSDVAATIRDVFTGGKTIDELGTILNSLFSTLCFFESCY